MSSARQPSGTWTRRHSSTGTPEMRRMAAAMWTILRTRADRSPRPPESCGYAATGRRTRLVGSRLRARLPGLIARRTLYDRQILRLALPALGSLLAEPVYVLTSTAIIGHLGTVPLAGLAAAAGIILTV